MFWTPARSETLTIMNAVKLPTFSWWRLTVRPDEVNSLVGRPFPVYRLSMRITLLCSHNSIMHAVCCIMKLHNCSYIATEDNWV